MRITIPTQLSEITLNQYLRFSKTLQDNPDDETFVAIQMVSIFCNLNIEEVMQILADPKTYNRCTHTNFDLDRAQCVAAEIAKKIYEDYL